MLELSGQIIDHEHRLPIRVYYEDTDFSGVVYYANYLKFFERGRSDYLRLIGVHHHELAALPEPLAFAVADIHVRYKAPARIDDLIETRTRMSGLRGASFHVSQRLLRGDQVLTEAEVKAVCIDLNGRLRRLPPDLQARLAACCVNEKDA
ncbi:MAG TPA: tol-pal system-associated acyl-CoA thioesterase [Asticcacaulis sp.]|nr:tol-pal system-associated acyl-CoA thioesterase [Asticcacaulis sp.]